MAERGLLPVNAVWRETADRPIGFKVKLSGLGGGGIGAFLKVRTPNSIQPRKSLGIEPITLPRKRSAHLSGGTEKIAQGLRKGRQRVTNCKETFKQNWGKRGGGRAVPEGCGQLAVGKQKETG